MAFIPNPDFIEQLADETVGVIAQEAERAADESNSLQHRIMPWPGIEITVEIHDGEVFLVNPNKGGHLDEFGSKNNPPYAPLRNGVLNAGFDLEET